jgi:tRNA threonylcarbamoyladenosine biosynthesis protein TsaB
MKLLAIDTSTERASVALAIGENIYCDEQDSLRQHAQRLLPMIEGLLARASISFKHLDGIVFGRGPGSFTGLRVACSVAKALAYAHDLPLYPVSSLASIAEDVYAMEPDTSVLAILDARMHEIYWAYISRDEAFPQEHVTAAAEVIVPNAPVIVAGTGLEIYAEQFPDGLKAQLMAQRNVYPQASAMIRLVRRGLVQPVNVDEALPVYVRELHYSKKG